MGILEHEFAVNALAGATIIAAFLPLLSFFVVSRNLSFTGVGVSHSAFGGLALGVLLGVNPLLTAVGFAVVVALVLAEAYRQGVSEDTTTGVLFAGSMALGAIFLGLARGTRIDLWTYLFGNLLSLSHQDIAILLTVGVMALGFLLFTKRHLLLLAFDPELALATGVKVNLLNAALMVLIGLSVVACIRAVGIVLLSGLMVFPGAIGVRLARSYKKGILISYAAGAVAVFGGLAVSFWLDLPSGATIVMSGTVLFLLSLLKP